jgi:hypothetical protein
MDLSVTWLEVAGARVPEAVEGRSLVTLLTGGDYEARKYVFAERNWHANWDPMRCVVGRRYKLIQNYRPEIGYRPLDRIRVPRDRTWRTIENLKAAGRLGDKLECCYFSSSRPQVELYDLEEDPGEWHNLAGEPAYQELVDEYQEALSAWMNSTHDFLPPPRHAFPSGSYDHVDPLDGEAR